MDIMTALAISAGIGLVVGAIVTLISGTRNTRMVISLFAGMIGALIGAGGLLLAEPSVNVLAVMGLATVFAAVGALIHEVVVLMLQVRREPSQPEVPVYEAKTPSYKIEDLETTIIRIKQSRQAIPH
jgi:hypothetical protein